MFHPYILMQLQLFLKLLNTESINERNGIEKNKI